MLVRVSIIKLHLLSDWLAKALQSLYLGAWPLQLDEMLLHELALRAFCEGSSAPQRLTLFAQAGAYCAELA